MTNDKKHAADCRLGPPHFGGCTCVVAQELDLDAMEERVQRSLAYAGKVIEMGKADVLALISRVREAEQLLRDRPDTNYTGRGSPWDERVAEFLKPKAGG